MIFLNQFYVNNLKLFSKPIIHDNNVVYIININIICILYLYTYNMFSKHLYPLGHNCKNEFLPDNPSITYHDFIKKKIELKKFKIPELKVILKSHHMKISGSKQVLIDRLEDYFSKCSRIVLIQKTFRRYIVKLSLSLRGEGFKDRTKCVNDSDFYSLEPLYEIPHEYLFTFTSGKFTYGCNIISLLHLIKNKTLVKNPYNRENIAIEVIQDIFKLYGLIQILYGFPSDAPVINTKSLLAIHTNINDNQRIRESMTPSSIITNTHSVISNELFLERQNKLRTMRAKPILTRIRELFMEIDQLGNYTQYEWFLNLERRDYIRLYRTLHDIWSFRGHLSREMKCLICIVDDPFHELHRERVYLNDATMEVIREMCLKIFEHMVYCGVDDEYRKIGTLHALSALTIVSTGARNALSWLYESLYG